MSSEFERIARIRRALDRPVMDVLVANGDDAAVFTLTGHTVASVDTCIENTHFRIGWLSYADLGWRSQVSALSDLTAMGAESRFVMIALAAPKHFPDEALDALCSGVGEALDQAGAVLIGGNVSASETLSITTTALGETAAGPILRSGARAGDNLYVTGTLGGGAAGLFALLNNKPDEAAILRWQRPPLRTHFAAELARCATACIDISDGLGQDLAHLAKASNVGFEVDAHALPLSDGLPSKPGSYMQAWQSGEEYELLFTAADSPTFEARHIGRACEQPGIRLIADGQIVATENVLGFDHFR